jgi:two-component system nitrate/nitrite response regulator NarL
VVDDHPLSLHALTAVLGTAGHDVVGVAQSAEEGVKLIARTRPRVAVVDLGLPAPGGLDVVRHVAKKPDVRVLVCTGSLEASDLQDALAAGAAGITSKASALESVVEGVEAVAAGHFHLDERVKQAIAAARTEGPNLTSREKEILQLTAQGMSLERIAAELFLSPETVRTHLRNSRRKLGARTRTEAVVAAMRTSQIRMPD